MNQIEYNSLNIKKGYSLNIQIQSVNIKFWKDITRIFLFNYIIHEKKFEQIIKDLPK